MNERKGLYGSGLSWRIPWACRPNRTRGSGRQPHGCLGMHRTGRSHPATSLVLFLFLLLKPITENWSFIFNPLCLWSCPKFLFGRITPPSLTQPFYVCKKSIVHGEYPFISLRNRGSENSCRSFRRGYIILMMGVHYLKAMPVPFIFWRGVGLMFRSLLRGLSVLNSHDHRGLSQLYDIHWIRDSRCTMR